MPHRIVRRWWLAPITLAILVGHLIVPYVVVRATVSVAIVSIAVGVLIVKHLGIGGR